MNIAGPLAQGGGNNQVDQIDHRRLVGHHFDVVRALLRGRAGGRRLEVVDHLLDRHLAGLGDLFQQFGPIDRLFLHFQPCQEPDVLDHPLISRSGRGDHDDPAAHFHRQNAVALDEFGRQRGHGVGVRFQTRLHRRRSRVDAVISRVRSRHAAQILHKRTPLG